MPKRIFPAGDSKSANRLAKGKSTYANNASAKRQIITRGRIGKRVNQRTKGDF